MQKSLKMLIFFSFGKTFIKALLMDFLQIEYNILKAGLVTLEKKSMMFFEDGHSSLVIRSLFVI